MRPTLSRNDDCYCLAIEIGGGCNIGDDYVLSLLIGAMLAVLPSAIVTDCSWV